MKISFLQIPGMKLIVLPVVFVGAGTLFFMLEQAVLSRLSAWFAPKSGGRSALS